MKLNVALLLFLLCPGVASFALDACLARYGVPCSQNGRCVLDASDRPICVCRPQFQGDGFSCLNYSVSIPRPPQITVLPPTSSLFTATPSPLNVAPSGTAVHMKPGQAEDLDKAGPSQGGSSSVLLIVIPCVLCGVWLLLIVLLVLCLRRRRSRKLRDFDVGYYMPREPSGSQLSIPRPVAVGDRSHYGVSLHCDPYAAYKY